MTPFFRSGWCGPQMLAVSHESCDIGNPQLVGGCPRTLSFHQITRLRGFVGCCAGAPLAWNVLKVSARHH